MTTRAILWYRLDRCVGRLFVKGRPHVLHLPCAPDIPSLMEANDDALVVLVPDIVVEFRVSHRDHEGVHYTSDDPRVGAWAPA